MTDPELRPKLPTYQVASDEATTLVEMLDFYRAVLARKGSGLSNEQLATSLAPSDLTIGGLIHHMAFVEDFWFDHRFAGNDGGEPWASMDWASDPDAEMTQAKTMTSDELFAQFESSLTRSRAAYAAADSLGQLSMLERDGEHWNLRWIMVHMIEEYARHCGHADFIRQSIDGVVDD